MVKLTEKLRKKFEKWWVGNGHAETRLRLDRDGNYAHDETHACWMLWQSLLTPKPIQTAPKSRRIMLFTDNRWRSAQWSDLPGQFRDNRTGENIVGASHWQECPPDPG